MLSLYEFIFPRKVATYLKGCTPRSALPYTHRAGCTCTPKVGSRSQRDGTCSESSANARVSAVTGYCLPSVGESARYSEAAHMHRICIWTHLYLDTNVKIIIIPARSARPSSLATPSHTSCKSLCRYDDDIQRHIEEGYPLREYPQNKASKGRGALKSLHRRLSDASNMCSADVLILCHAILIFELNPRVVGPVRPCRSPSLHQRTTNQPAGRLMGLTKEEPKGEECRCT